MWPYFSSLDFKSSVNIFGWQPEREVAWHFYLSFCLFYLIMLAIFVLVQDVSDKNSIRFLLTIQSGGLFACGRGGGIRKLAGLT